VRSEHPIEKPGQRLVNFDASGAEFEGSFPADQTPASGTADVFQPGVLDLRGYSVAGVPRYNQAGCRSRAIPGGQNQGAATGHRCATCAHWLKLDHAPTISVGHGHTGNRQPMSGESILPRGEALRRAVRWLGDQPRHDAASIEEAARRFDLTPADEEFLLRHFRDQAAGPAMS
jgi:hypothetical protein